MKRTMLSMRGPTDWNVGVLGSLTMQADVVIVGGGVMGCAVAWRLARRGARRIVVLERSIPGAEASSAAAGILGAQAESDAAGPLLELMLRSRAAWPAFAGELREASGVD